MSSTETEDEDETEEEEDDEDETEEEDEDEDEDDDDDENDEDEEYTSGDAETISKDPPPPARTRSAASRKSAASRASTRRSRSVSRSKAPSDDISYEYEYEYEYEEEAAKKGAENTNNKGGAKASKTSKGSKTSRTSKTSRGSKTSRLAPKKSTRAAPTPPTVPATVVQPPAQKAATKTPSKTNKPPVNKFAAVEKKLLSSDSGEVIAVFSPVATVDSVSKKPSAKTKKSVEPSKRGRTSEDDETYVKKSATKGTSPSKSRRMPSSSTKKKIGESKATDADRKVTGGDRKGAGGDRKAADEGRKQTGADKRTKPRNVSFKGKSGKQKKKSEQPVNYYDSYIDSYSYYGDEDAESNYEPYYDYEVYSYGSEGDEAYYYPGDSTRKKKRQETGSSFKGIQGRAPSLLFMQVMTFAALYISYLFFLINRKSFSYTRMAFYETEYTSPFHIDLILTSQNLAYAMSRCLGGVLSDRMSPTILLTVGLFSSSLFMIAFADSDNILSHCTLAFLNGSVQGFGWPAAAKLIKTWLEPSHLGTWWAVFSTATNVASLAGPHLITFLADVHTWQIALQLPAVVGLILSLIFFFTMRDRPADVGYRGRDLRASSVSVSSHAPAWGHLLGAPVVWVLVCGSAVVYGICAATSYWGQHLLVDERGLSEVAVGAYLHSLQLGGLAGCLVSGVTSDFMVRASKPKLRGGSPRMLLTQIFVAGIVICLNLMVFTVEQYTSTLWIGFLGAAMGFCIYGSICLFGVMAMECAPLHVTGFMQALIAVAANFGSLLAGEGVLAWVPVAFVSRYMTWVWAFVGLEVVCIAMFFVLVLTKDISHSVENLSNKKRI